MEKLTDSQADEVRTLADSVLARYRNASLVGFIVLVLAIGYALSTKPDTESLTNGLKGSCMQVNTLQAKTNLDTVNTFEARVTSYQREYVISISNAPDAKVHAKSAAQLKDQAAKLTLTGLVNCGNAVKDKSYKFPVADPVGNPKTGVLTADANRIRKQSVEVLNRSTVDVS